MVKKPVLMRELSVVQRPVPSLSMLSIVCDDDINVGFRPLHALLVYERIVQFQIYSLSRS